jgi:hypothetical protein
MLVYPPRSGSRHPIRHHCGVPIVERLGTRRSPNAQESQDIFLASFIEMEHGCHCQTPAAMSNNELVFEMVFLDVRAAKGAMEGADPWSRLIQGFRACPLISQGVTYVREMPGCQPGHKPGHGRSMTQRRLSVC